MKFSFLLNIPFWYGVSFLYSYKNKEIKWHTGKHTLSVSPTKYNRFLKMKVFSKFKSFHTGKKIKNFKNKC